MTNKLLLSFLILMILVYFDERWW